MRTRTFSAALAFVMFVAAFGSFHLGHAQSRPGSQGAAQICGDPTQSCRSLATFEPHDINFRIVKQSVIWESELFYAIILKSMRVPEGDCDQFISESERLAAQALFPKRKVFTSRCAEPATLYYMNVSDDARFMAVYAGKTKAEADRVLGEVKATSKFPGANIRRIRAGFNGT
jgi:hypothetical protein